MCARLRGWPLPVTLQIDAVTRRCRRQVIAWSRRVLRDEMTAAVEEARPVVARRAVALMEEAVGLHMEEAEMLGLADCTSSAAPLPCTPAVARAFLALAVEGGADAAARDADADEGGSAFGSQLERILTHAVARAKPQRSGRPAERLLGLQASDRLDAFGLAPTRFGVGARVECRFPGSHTWQPGTVSTLWVRATCPSPNSPQLHLHAYRVLLDGRDGAPPRAVLIADDDEGDVRSASQPLLALPAPSRAGSAMTVELLLQASGWRVECSATLATVRDVLGGEARRARAEARAREAAAARAHARQAEVERQRRRQQEQQRALQREAAEEHVAPLLRRAEGVLLGTSSSLGAMSSLSDEELLAKLRLESAAYLAEREALLAALRQNPAQLVGEATAAHVRSVCSQLEAETARIKSVLAAEQQRLHERAQREEAERRMAEEAARRAAAEQERARKRVAEEARRRQQAAQRAEEEARRQAAAHALGTAAKAAEAGGAPELAALERALAAAEAAGVVRARLQAARGAHGRAQVAVRAAQRREEAAAALEQAVTDGRLREMEKAVRAARKAGVSEGEVAAAEAVAQAVRAEEEAARAEAARREAERKEAEREAEKVRLQRREEEARLRREAEAQARQEAEAQAARLEAEARVREEAEARAREEAEARAREEAEARVREAELERQEAEVRARRDELALRARQREEAQREAETRQLEAESVRLEQERRAALARSREAENLATPAAPAAPAAPAVLAADAAATRREAHASQAQQASGGNWQEQLLADTEALDELSCPITHVLMQDPVVAADGMTYEKVAIERWLESHDTSPMTGEVLEHKFLVKNHLVRGQIQKLLPQGAVTGRDGRGGRGVRGGRGGRGGSA